MPGANDALAKLTAAGTKVCLMSCLSRPAFRLTMERLGWWQRGDLLLCADDVARGFPWPDLVLTAILRLGIGDVRDVAVVTASESGVLSARRAGARLVIGVLSGVDDGRRLRRAEPPTCWPTSASCRTCWPRPFSPTGQLAGFPLARGKL